MFFGVVGINWVNVCCSDSSVGSFGLCGKISKRFYSGKFYFKNWVGYSLFLVVESWKYFLCSGSFFYCVCSLFWDRVCIFVSLG